MRPLKLILILATIFCTSLKANDLRPENPLVDFMTRICPGDNVLFVFEVNFGFDFPVHANEWNTTIFVVDDQTQMTVFSTSVPGVDRNQSGQIIGNTTLEAPQPFIPSGPGTFTVFYDVFYQFDVNTSNNEIQNQIMVTSPPGGVSLLEPSQGSLVTQSPSFTWSQPISNTTSSVFTSTIHLQQVSPIQGGVISQTLSAPLTTTVTLDTELEGNAGYEWWHSSQGPCGTATTSRVGFSTQGPCYDGTILANDITATRAYPVSATWSYSSGPPVSGTLGIYHSTSPILPGTTAPISTTTDLSRTSWEFGSTDIVPDQINYFQVGVQCETGTPTYSNIVSWTPEALYCPPAPITAWPMDGAQNFPGGPVVLQIDPNLQGLNPSLISENTSYDVVLRPSNPTFDTEIIQMNLTGTLQGLPQAFPDVSLVPGQQYTVTPRVHCDNTVFEGSSSTVTTQTGSDIMGNVGKVYQQGGTPMPINSFFDVFTEITIDVVPPGFSPPSLGITVQPNPDGSFNFPNIPTCTFETRIIGLDEWLSLTPSGGIATGTITPSGVVPPEIPFIYIPPPSEVTGRKWQDDGDEQIDPDDLPLGGWLFDLIGTSFAGSEVNETATTGSDGLFSFPTINPGTYAVRERTLTGWRPAIPASGESQITVDEGIDITGLEFLNVPPFGSIHGRKFFDWLQDGEFNGEDIGLNGFIIELLDAQGNVIARDTTHFMNVDQEGPPNIFTDFGWFWFNNLPPGIYRLREIIPDGWQITTPQGNLHEVELAPGQTIDNLLFGNFAENIDFGDLPEPADTTFGTCTVPQCYPTLLPTGAGHVAVGPKFGALRDTEGDGIPSVFADGDDSTGVDDEDGVAFLSFVPSVSGEVEYTVTGVAADFPCFVSGWIDFNADGYLGTVFVNPEEQVVFQQINAPGTYRSTFNIPQLVQGAGYARFRVSKSFWNAAFPFGIAPDGEVEDYVGLGFDYGDANNDIDPTNNMFPTGYPVKLVDDGARHIPTPTIRLGSIMTDKDNDGQPTTYSTGDDYNDRDDEDGIQWEEGYSIVYNGPDPKTPNRTLTVIGLTESESVTFKPLATWVGFLNAWIDYNRDGDWDDLGEQIFDDEPIRTGPDYTLLTINVPDVISYGFSYIRFRYTINPDVNVTGPESTGEVEDYLIALLPPIDFGDAPADYPTLFFDNGAKHMLSEYYLGELIDPEPDGIPHIEAMGDDEDNLRDEDGIQAVSGSVRGSEVELEVVSNTPAGATGYLSGWVDYNHDETWDPVTEKVLDDVELNGGTDTIKVLIPTDAMVGETFARFRFSNITGLGPNDPNPLTNLILPLGEVEDYKITIDSILVTVNEFDYVPTEFKLHQNFPNPFNPSTVIRYDVASTGHVKLEVYNIIGQHVATLVDEEKAPGAFKVEFQIDDLPTGIYIYSMQIGEFVNTKKMILMK